MKAKQKTSEAERTGNLLIVLGMLMILSCLVLLYQNLRESRDAADAAGEAAAVVREYIETAQSEAPSETEPQEEKLEVLYEAPVLPEMPVIALDGNRYIGMLKILAVDLELPVMSECTDSNMKQGPCRYSGSLQTDDLVICAHNYQSSFGRLRQLSVGDVVVFTAMDGKEYRYTVGETEVLEPTAIEQMIDSDWDLSLYTCTYYGKQRLTVRCRRLGKTPRTETEEPEEAEPETEES